MPSDLHLAFQMGGGGEYSQQGQPCTSSRCRQQQLGWRRIWNCNWIQLRVLSIFRNADPGTLISQMKALDNYCLPPKHTQILQLVHPKKHCAINKLPSYYQPYDSQRAWGEASFPPASLFHGKLQLPWNWSCSLATRSLDAGGLCWKSNSVGQHG